MYREKLLVAVYNANERRQEELPDKFGYTSMMMRFIIGEEHPTDYLHWRFLYVHGMHCLPNLGEHLGEYVDDPYDSICEN